MFGEFETADALESWTPPDLDELRAAAAFLRQEVLPFCRWEEDLLLAAPDEWEAAAFDHGFLAAEIDAFGREVTALEETREWDDEARRRASQRLLRRVHRIEAVLELHMQRAEDWGIRVNAPDEGRPEQAGPGGGSTPPSTET